MSDDGLRALERRYRDTGAVDDHAKWIVARVRAGALSESRAELAAELGHQAARLALGVGLAPLTRVTVDRVVRACDRDDPAWVHGGIALGVSQLALTGTLSHRERDGLARLSAWVDCPCAEHDAAVEDAADQALVFNEAELRALFPGPWVSVFEEVLVDWRATRSELPLWPQDLSMVGWVLHGGSGVHPDADGWLAVTRFTHALRETPDGQRRLARHAILVSNRVVGAWSVVSCAIARSGEGPVRSAVAEAVGPSLLQEAPHG